MLVVSLSIIFYKYIAIKGCICAIVLIFYFLVCQKLKPYATLNLNKLSMLSTSTHIVTLILNLCNEEILY